MVNPVFNDGETFSKPQLSKQNETGTLLLRIVALNVFRGLFALAGYITPVLMLH